MAIISLATIKSYFVTGAIPTEAQYSDTWDSFRHKDDALAQDQVTNLAPLTAAFAPSAAISVPADVMVRELIIKDVTTGGTLNVGSTPGGSEYYSTTVSTGQTYTIDLGQYFPSSGTIYLSGGPEGNAKLYIQ